MKNLLSVSIPVLALILSGCSGGSSSGGNGVSATQPITNVSGSVLSQMTPNKIYQPVASTCIQDSSNSSYYYKESFGFLNNEFAHLRDYYEDSSCISLIFYASRVMSFVSYTNVQDYQIVNMSLLDFQLSITNQILLDVYDQNRFYDLSWNSLGNAQSVIDRKFQPSDSTARFISGTITNYQMKMILSSLFVNGIQYQ